MSILVTSLSFSYPHDRSFRLRDPSFSLQAGEIFGLTGKNGAGKSTLLQIMAGLLQAQSGSIQIDGKPIDYRKVPVGLVNQQPEKQLFARTVFEDIAFGPINQGLSLKQAEERVKTAMLAVGLDPLIYSQRSPFSLSTGEKRKAALAGVLALDSDYLLFDEPMAGLDAPAREQMKKLLCHLREEGKGILLVSHHMEDLLSLCDRIMLMENGQISMAGDALEVMAEMEATQGAMTASRQVLYRLREEGFHLNPESCRSPQEAAGQIEELYRTSIHKPGAQKKQSPRNEIAEQPSYDLENYSDKEEELPPVNKPASLSSRFHLDPRSRMIFTFLLAVMIFGGKTTIDALLILGIISADFVLSAQSLRRIFSGTGVLFLLILITALLLLFTVPGELLWKWGIFTISREGLSQAIIMAVKLVLLVVVMQMLVTGTSITGLLHGLEWFLSPLKRLRFPVGELVLIMTISLRFIPILNREMTEIRMAQRARGAVFNQGALTKRLNMQISLLVPLLANTMQRAEKLAQAMESRGYMPGIHRGHLQSLKWGYWDGIYLIVSLCILGLSWAF